MKSLIRLLILFMCVALMPVSVLAEGTPAADGEYQTGCWGRNGYVNVITTIKDGKIAEVKLGDNIETDVFCNPTVPTLLQEIVDNNSYNVDGVSGATWTYAAIKTAVRDAIKEAGGSLELYNKKPEKVKGPDETIEADVVVVGAGLSGITAAARAGMLGAKVVLLEKTTILGGCSAYSSGPAHYAPEDVGDKFVSWLQDQHFMVDTTVLYTYLSRNDEALSFLQSFNHNGLLCPGAPEAWRLAPYLDRGPVYQDIVDTAVIGNGGSVYLQATGKKLLTENGRVTGVIAERKDGSTLTVKAKAVVIATGGYGGNKKMVLETSGLDVVCGCLTQCVGEGLQMAWEAGAAKSQNIGGLQLHQTLATSQLVGYDYFQFRMPAIMGYVPSLLNVSKKGIRFRNEEWVNTATFAAGSGAATGGPTYTLLDQSTIDKITEGGLAALGDDILPKMPPALKPQFTLETPWENCKQVFDDTVKGGWGFYGETIEELAENAGMDPAILRETFDTYQSYCENGNDPFMRKDPKYLVKYEYGPYYLVEITYNQLGTISGLNINARMQVLDEAGNPIPGLYSVGSDASGVLYDNNYSGRGDALGWALTSGYVAGESICEAISK